MMIPNSDSEGSGGRWERLKELFDKAATLALDERERFVAKACAGDPSLRAEVERLLAADELDDSFIEPPQTIGVDDEIESSTRRMVGQRVGAYRLLSPIGSGGMGEVFLAERADGAFEKQAAVKIIKRGMESVELLGRFRSERQALARLEHPNIARLYDGGLTEDHRPYLVMEYVDGKPIDEYCDDRRASIVERLELLRLVCAAVHYAHQNLIVHRDLKPDNIVVTAEGVPKLLDFGIAKLLDPHSASEGFTAAEGGPRLMTLDYASPEQVRGEPVTTASDVYSLGVVLYKLLTGHRPYRLSSHRPSEIEHLVCFRDPEKPSTAVTRVEETRACDGTARASITPESVSRARRTTPEKLGRGLRGDLDTIVMMAMRKEPARRYASAEQLAEDIRRSLCGWPVTARPDTLGYRVAKFAARNKIGVSAVTAVVLALVSGVITTSWQARRARLQRDAAQANLVRADHVSRFLVDLFAVSDPARSLGETVTARELLHRGAERIRSELRDQPPVQALLMDTIGNVYSNLGLYGPAAEMLEEALAIRRRELGSPQSELADAMNNLGVLRNKMVETSASEDLNREALAIRRSVFGPRHATVAQSLNNLGLTLHTAGRYVDAEPLLREALAMRRELLGDENADTGISRNNLAGLLHAKGDYAGAEILLREALAVERKLKGALHPDVATRLNNLGLIVHAKGDRDAAEALYREALAIRRKVLGETHPDVATTVNNLGGLLYEKGDFEGAERSFQEALSIARAAHGPEHPMVARMLNNLGLALHGQKRYVEAEPLMLEALTMRRKLLREGHPDIAVSLCRLGELLLDETRVVEAQPLLNACVEIRERSLPANHWQTAEAKCALGRCLLELQQYEPAELFLVAGFDVLQTQRGPSCEQTVRARDALIRLYDATGRTEEAAKYRSASPPANASTATDHSRH